MLRVWTPFSVKPIRVLCKDGALWLNVGNSYACNDGTRVCGPNAKVGNTKKLITETKIARYRTARAYKDRNLIGLPWRIVLALQADGWILRSKTI